MTHLRILIATPAFVLGAGCLLVARWLAGERGWHFAWEEDE